LDLDVLVVLSYRFFPLIVECVKKIINSKEGTSSPIKKNLDVEFILFEGILHLIVEDRYEKGINGWALLPHFFFGV